VVADGHPQERRQHQGSGYVDTDAWDAGCLKSSDPADGGLCVTGR